MSASRHTPPAEPTRRRRVVLAIESSGPGGAERTVLHLANGLRERGIDPIIATLRPGWLTKRANDTGVETWIVPQARGWSIGWIPRFAQCLAHERISLLHGHEFAMSVYGGSAARLARIPALVTLHGRHWVASRRLRAIAYRGLDAVGVRIAAVSNDLAHFLAGASGLSRRSVAVIENGIPIAPIRDECEVAALRTAMRSQLGLDARTPLLVAVGNLYPVKDHASLVHALIGLEGVHLAIAGRGDEQVRLESLARDLGVAARLHLLGLRDDIEEWLAAADVFVHPSRSEEMPLAILEAMAQGLPIVATRVGGVPDAVVDGETGVLVPSGDVKRLREAIRTLLADEDRRRALGRAARARAEDRFSAKCMVDRTLRAYAEAAPRTAW
jgi:glycosyltransferase involved in cell wall biosynthesis